MATRRAQNARSVNRRILRTAHRNVQLLNLLVENEASQEFPIHSDVENGFDHHTQFLTEDDVLENEVETAETFFQLENDGCVDGAEFGDVDRHRCASVDSNEESLIGLEWQDVEDVFCVDENTNIAVEQSLSFREQLASWAVLPGVFHVHVNQLLSILRSHPCHSDLPKDVRTLLKTPRKVHVQKMHPGEYFGFGILSGLSNVLSLAVHFESLSIEILINVDGLPIFSNSTSKQLWVILGLVRGINGLEKIPFIIAIYFGLEKPVGGPNSFLRGMVDELKDLIEKGFSFAGYHFTIKRIIFVCDAPARAFITGVKYHSGFSSCSKCITVGETVVSASEIRRLVSPRGRRVFPCTSAALRTNQSFRDRYDIDHHNYYSCIEELETVDMVLDVPVDPMHLVDEGAGKKLFMTIMEDTDYKISPYNVRRVNEDMSSLSKFTPREFARRSRPFSHNLKSTEWSQALKYTCPVIFRNRLSQERYEHMLTLHVAVKILSSERFCIQFNAYAKSLLQVFVENASRLYGKTFITYNIHNLVHLAEDVMMFGPLYSFSAYVFENKLGTIKRLLRKSEKPLEQIIKRLAELQQNSSPNVSTSDSKFHFRVEHKNGPLLPLFINGSKQFGIVEYKKFTLTLKDGDNCVLLHERVVVKIENIVELSCKPFIIGRNFRNLKNLYPHPFDSTDFDIFQCSDLSDELRYWPLEFVQFKMYLMPLSGLQSFAAFPLENL